MKQTVGFNSFPTFNKEIDMKLLQSMTSLNTVYIQDISSKKAETNIRQLISQGKIEIIDDVRKFYIPY